MAISSCSPMGLSGTLNEKWEPQYNVRFKVVAGKFDGPVAVVTAMSSYGIGISKHYDLSSFGWSGETDTMAKCRRIAPTLAEQGPAPVWHVDVEYGVWNPFQVENPLEAPVIPVIRSIRVPRFVIKDKDGEALLNTAGTPYQPVEIDGYRYLLSFSKNYATLPTDLFPYQGYINTDSWQGFEPYTVKFNSANAEQLTSAVLESTYYKVDFEFEINYDLGLESGDDDAEDATNEDGSDESPATTGNYIGWLHCQLSEGLYQLQSSKLVPCMLPSTGGQVATTPQPLDATGAQIATPTTSNVVYSTHHVRPEAAFNTVFADLPTDLFAVQAYPSG